MPVLISMLRGINLASHKRIKMEALRALYESLGLREAQTYVQSGNAIFKTSQRDLAKLARTIEKGIESEFGFHSHVILRTPADLREVIRKNPFTERPELETNKLLVTFLASDPAKDAAASISKIKTDGEELWLNGRELFVYFRNGVGRSKVTPAAIEKALKTPGTARNWNTVKNLLAIAEEMERTPRTLTSGAPKMNRMA